MTAKGEIEALILVVLLEEYWDWRRSAWAW